METLLAALTVLPFFALVDTILRGWRNARRVRQAEDELEVSIRAAEDRAKTPRPLVESLGDMLSAASNRQSLLLLKSERRLQRLYTLGTWLITLSVLVPFLLVWVYWSWNPIDVLSRLKAAGVSPADASDIAHRDWHVLAAGVSFGLLFLAAARGVIGSEARHRDTYFLLNRRVSYYADLNSALQMADQLANHEQADKAVRIEAVKRVISQLLESARIQGADPIVFAPPETDNVVPEAIKGLAALVGKETK